MRGGGGGEGHLIIMVWTWLLNIAHKRGGGEEGGGGRMYQGSGAKAQLLYTVIMLHACRHVSLYLYHQRTPPLVAMNI